MTALDRDGLDTMRLGMATTAFLNTYNVAVRNAILAWEASKPSDPSQPAIPDLLAAAKQVVAWADPIAVCAPELSAAQTAFYNLRLAIAKAEGTT